MSNDNSSVTADGEMHDIAESRVARYKNRAASLREGENLVVAFSSQATTANVQGIITLVPENPRRGPRHILIYQKLKHAPRSP